MNFTLLFQFVSKLLVQTVKKLKAIFSKYFQFIYLIEYNLIL